MVKDLKDMTNKQLWKLFPIILVKHKKAWKKRYINEEENIIGAVGEENILRISHIGSTAVKGLVSKPTIDILLEINLKSNQEEIISKMESISYIYIPQPNPPPPHYSFYKGYTNKGFKGQVFHVHVRENGDHDELYFKDYLIKHPKTAQEYGRLKIGLLKKYKHDRDGYTEAKSGFIKKATLKAREEFKNRYKQ